MDKGGPELDPNDITHIGLGGPFRGYFPLPDQGFKQPWVLVLAGLFIIFPNGISLAAMLLLFPQQHGTVG